jgi:hypothetical protein
MGVVATVTPAATTEAALDRLDLVGRQRFQSEGRLGGLAQARRLKGRWSPAPSSQPHLLDVESPAVPIRDSQAFDLALARDDVQSVPGSFPGVNVMHAIGEFPQPGPRQQLVSIVVSVADLGRRLLLLSSAGNRAALLSEIRDVSAPLQGCRPQKQHSHRAPQKLFHDTFLTAADAGQASPGCRSWRRRVGSRQRQGLFLAGLHSS